MKDKDWNYVVDIILICAIVYLAVNDKDGWGWLMLLLFLKN
jgi:hypothetical protein